MALRIKVSRLDFDAACTNGYVDGQESGRPGVYVYAELGKEKEYIPNANDDPKTNYRLFLNCDVSYAKTEENAAEGIFEHTVHNETVIILC